MRITKRSAMWLRALFAKRAVEAELHEEMSFHIEMAARKFELEGLSPEDAWRRARMTFGSLDQHKEAMRDGRGMRGIERTLADLRFAQRQLRRAPGFTIAAVLTLAIGIGGNTAVSSVIHSVLLQPLDYPNAERIVTIAHHTRGGDLPELLASSSATHVLYEQASRSFDAVALYNVGQASLVGDQRPPDWIDVVTTTRSLFDVLRIPPLLGRTFSAEEDAPGGPAVAIISDALWRQRFGGDSSILGRTIQIDGRARLIVGVMPARFAFPSPKVSVWLPMHIDRGALSGFHDNSIARLRDGVTAEQATRELTLLLPRVSSMVDFLPANILRDSQLRPMVRPYIEEVVGAVKPMLWTLWTMLGLVMLIACVNVASLVSVRAEARRQELAVRIALGAERRHLLLQSLAESSMLLAMGGVLGLSVAYGVVSVLPRLVPDLPRVSDVRIDTTVLGYTFLVVIVVAFVFGLIPVLRHGRMGASEAMRGSARRTTIDRRSARLRRMLVVSQVAMATIVLVASGLVLRSFQALRAVDPGFKPDGVMTFRLTLPFARYRTSAEVARFHFAMLDAIRALPGVTSAGATGRLPLAGVQAEPQIDPLRVEGHVQAQNTLPPLAEMRVATPGYFETMGIPILKGRGLEVRDAEEHTGAVLVSEAVVRKLFDNREPIGRHVAHGLEGTKDQKPWSDVVGVVGDVRGVSLDKEPIGAVYYGVINKPDVDMDWLARSMTFVVRGTVPPGVLIDAVRGELARRDRALPIADVRTLSSVVDDARRGMRMSTIGLAVAAFIGLFMSAIGLYGVLSYVTAQRTREIGVRLALGASPASVLVAVVRDGLALCATGLAAGVLGSVLLRSIIKPLLYGISPADPQTMLIVSVLLLLVGLTATWLPARRAALVDPMNALRWE